MKFVPFNMVIPSIITIAGLIIGVSSIRFALVSKWELAVTCIVFAAIIDGIDGRIARALKSSSNFGAELDSLCDLANFGVSPGVLIYLWAFQQYEFYVISWASILLFVSCIAIRLAKFNIANIIPGHLTQEKASDKNYSKINFFFGIPAPGAAILLMIPIMLEFSLEGNIDYEIKRYKILINIYIIAIALLASSNIPSFSLKGAPIPKEYLLPLMILSIIIVIITILYPWYAMPVLGFLYLVSLFLSYTVFHRQKKK